MLKIFGFVSILLGFTYAYGPVKENEFLKENVLYFFCLHFVIELCPWLINIKVCNPCKDFALFLSPSNDFILFLVQFATGISFFIVSVAIPGQISLSNQKALAGLYSIWSAYSLIRNFRFFVPLSIEATFDFFEVVFWNVMKLLLVSK